MSDKSGAGEVGRRRVLRDVGVALAGAAGATVAGAVAATPAHAAPGDAVTLGSRNNAGTTETTVTTGNAAGATLRLENTAIVPDSFGDPTVGPALRFTPAPAVWISENAPAGSVAMTEDGTLHYVPVVDGDGQALSEIYTGWSANQFVPVTPVRVLDTRSPATAGRLVNRGGNVDSGGRVIGGRTLNLDLSEFAYYAEAVYLNVTVTEPAAAGWIAVFPYDSGSPRTATLNYSTGSVVSNFSVVGAGYGGDLTTALSIYSLRNTHVLVDVTGFVVSYRDQVNPSALGVARDTADPAAERQRLLHTTRAPWNR